MPFDEGRVRCLSFRSCCSLHSPTIPLRMKRQSHTDGPAGDILPPVEDDLLNAVYADAGTETTTGYRPLLRGNHTRDREARRGPLEPQETAEVFNSWEACDIVGNDVGLD